MRRVDPSTPSRISYGCAIAALMLVSEVTAQPVTSQNVNEAPNEAAQRQALSPFRAILNSASSSPRAKPSSTPAPSMPRPAVQSSPPQAATSAAEPVTPVRSTSASRSSRPGSASSDVDPLEAAPPPAATTSAPAPKAAEAAPVQAPPPPKLIALRQDPPELPRSLQRRGGAQGTVKLTFGVNPDGSTADVRVVSSTNAQLDDAAVKAVSKWLFQPVQTKGLAEIDLVFEGQ